MRAAAKVVIVVLDEAGEPVGEGIFTAYADRPTVASIAERNDRSREGEGEFIPFPRAAALDVEKETVPAVTETASQ